MVGKTDKQVEMAYNEVGIFKDLEHPFIVKYVESFQEGQEIVIVMEYCEEGDLAYHIRWHKTHGRHFS